MCEFVPVDACGVHRKKLSGRCFGEVDVVMLWGVCVYGLLQIRMKVLFGDQWPLLKRVLTEDIAMALDSYWDRVRREEEQGITISPAAEVCAIIHLAMILVILKCGATALMTALSGLTRRKGSTPPTAENSGHFHPICVKM